MAESPQTLLEFSENILSDMGRGAITAQEAISACQQYGYLRDALSTKSGKLTEASLTGDEELVRALQEILEGATTKLRELPSFQAQEPDAPQKEKEIRDAAFLRTTALHRTNEHAASQLLPYQKKRREFIHQLVTKYSNQVPKTNNVMFDTAFDSAVVSAAKVATTRQTQERLAEMMAASVEISSGTTLSASQRTDLQRGVVDALSNHKELVTQTISVEETKQKLTEAIYEHLDLKRPDVLVDVVSHDPSGNTDAAVIRGTKLAKAAEALSGNDRTDASRSFFSQTTARGVTKGAQQAAEGLLSLVGEPLREIIIKKKVDGTLRSILTNTQRLTDRLGETFVHSTLFAKISNDLSRSMAEKPPATKVGGVFDDVFTAVFRGPLDAGLTDASADRIADYFELSRASANAPKGYSFFPDGSPIWSVFPILPRRRRGGRSRSLFSLFPFLSLGFLGGAIGNLFSWFVDRTTSFLFSTPSIPRQLSSSRRAASTPTPFLEDLPLVLAVSVVAIIIILYVFPSPFNLTLIARSASMAEIFSSLIPANYQGPTGSVGPIGPATLSCAKTDGVHIYQSDPQWAGLTCNAVRPDEPACHPPTSCTIGASGCGSTSATMILNSFGVGTDITTVWNTQHKDGGYAYYPDKSCASYWSGPINILRASRLSVDQIGIDEMANVFKQCGLVLAFVYEKWATGAPTGHVIVIEGIAQGNGVTQVTTLDPLRPAGYVSTVTDNPTHDGDINIVGLFGVVK